MSKFDHDSVKGISDEELDELEDTQAQDAAHDENAVTVSETADELTDGGGASAEQ